MRLPIGYLSLGPDGTVHSYTPTGDGAPPVDEVVGRDFFRDFDTGDDLERLRKRYLALVTGQSPEPYVSAQVQVGGSHHPQTIHLGFVRSPLKEEVIATVSRVDQVQLPVSAQVRPDAVHGTLTDAAGVQVVIANADFWHGLELLLARLGGEGSALQRFGNEWGLAHAVRVEGFVQRETSRTLRELEIEVALEYLSGSLAVIGLGHFEVDLDHRRRGIVVVDHHSSPFPALLTPSDGATCTILAGFHAGLFSYLSGRSLHARELLCAAGTPDRCRFLIGTQERLRALLTAEPTEPADLELMARLRTLGGRP